jgi:hypothetical protein
MAAAGIAPSLGRFGDVLAAAREHGEPFSDAWRIGLRTVKPCSDLRAILADTRDARQRAYNGQPPTQAERAVGELFGVLDGEPMAQAGFVPPDGVWSRRPDAKCPRDAANVRGRGDEGDSPAAGPP